MTETDAAIDELKRGLESPEMVDQISIEMIPAAESVDRTFEKIAQSVVSTRDATFIAVVGPVIVKIYISNDMSPNDPYVTVDSTGLEEILVVINTVHPHWSQLKGSEGVLNYLRHCTYDAIAEWQARSKASRIDPNTIKLLKDQLLRVPFKMDEHEGLQGV